MNRIIIKQSYTRLSDGDLDIKAMSIWQALENNAYFPNLAALPLLANAISKYHDALKAAGNNGRAEIAEKNKAKQEVVNRLHQLAAQVNAIADNDRTMLLTSGFDLKRAVGIQSKLDEPNQLKVVNGMNPGEMIVKVKKDSKVKCYNHEYSADPITTNSIWTTEPSTRSRYVFKGLQQEKKYWFRTIAIGTNGQTACSKEVSCIVL